VLRGALLIAVVALAGPGCAAEFDAGLASCPAFLASMKSAAQASDATDLVPYRQYLLGFERGYSWQAAAPYDVFAVLGDPPIDKALDAIAAWCSGQEQASFADGLKSVVRKMRTAAPPH
jgi:hypothetical protein